MFTSEEMKKRLEVIERELEVAPGSDILSIEPTDQELAMYAGRADAFLEVVYRMVRQLIDDIDEEIQKDEERAEADRRWFEKWKAEHEEDPDTEDAADAE